MWYALGPVCTALCGAVYTLIYCTSRRATAALVDECVACVRVRTSIVVGPRSCETERRVLSMRALSLQSCIAKATTATTQTQLVCSPPTRRPLVLPNRCLHVARLLDCIAFERFPCHSLSLALPHHLILRHLFHISLHPPSVLDSLTPLHFLPLPLPPPLLTLHPPPPSASSFSVKSSSSRKWRPTRTRPTRQRRASTTL